MATTFGTRPEDASADSRGNINVGVVHTLYPTEADALARTSPIGTATTNELGLWPFEDSANRLSLWVRNPAGNVWPVEAEGALAGKANQSDVDAALALKADASDLAGKADTTYVDTGLAAKIDTATANATYAAIDGPELAGKVDKGELVYSAADYASLSAAITAVPAGGTLRLAPDTIYPAAQLSYVAKDLTIEGNGPRSSIIDAGASAYGFTVPSSGSGRLTFRNVGFTGSTSAILRITATYHTSARFIDCRFSGFAQFAIENSGVDLACYRCEFASDGTPSGSTALFHQYGADRITLRDCTFRYLFRGLYCTDTNGPAKDVSISGCTFDGGWFLLKATATNTGGTVTYTATTLTDSAASFPALAVSSTVRAMAVKRAGNLTAVAGRLTDASANFTTAGVKRGDILRVAGKFGIVDEVVSSTVVKIEKWIDATTYEDTTPPSGSTAYAVYGLVIGRVASNTGTVITVDAWRDWDGTIATPAAGTMYELAPKTDYQCFILRADRVTITGNTFKRAWADQIAPLNSRNVVIANNNIYDGQDVGITVQKSGAYGQNPLITGNRINHQGSAAIWSNAADTRISDNSILDANWISLPASTYGAIMIEAGADRTVLSDNTIRRVNHPNSLKAIHLSGAMTAVELNDNKTSGFATQDIMITGAVDSTMGRFMRNTVITLVGGAVPPRGEFFGDSPPTFAALPGSTFRNAAGGAGTSFYVKESGTDATGWVGK